MLLPASTGSNQLPRFRVAHLFQTGKYLLTIHYHCKLTLSGATFNLYRNIFKVLLKFSGKTCRYWLLSSRCTILNKNLHKRYPPP